MDSTNEEFTKDPKVLKSLDQTKMIFLFLGENVTMEIEEMNVLNAVLSEKMTEVNREKIYEQYQIPDYIQKEVKNSMNVGQSIYEDGIEKGRLEGILETLLKNIQSLMSSGFTFEKSVQLLKVDEQTAKQIKEKIDELKHND